MNELRDIIGLGSDPLAEVGPSWGKNILADPRSVQAQLIGSKSDDRGRGAVHLFLRGVELFPEVVHRDPRLIIKRRRVPGRRGGVKALVVAKALDISP